MAGPEFEAKLDELLEDYRHVVWQSFQLPFFSLMPTVIFAWHYIIAALGFVLEIVILPYTLLALFLRLFKIRWKLILPFSKRVWYVLVYISRGEIFGSIVMRPVVRWLVKSHISRRLRALGELIATSENFTAEARARLGGKIAEAQARFPVRELNDFFKDSLIPALAIGAISLATDMVGDEEQKRVMRLIGYGVIAVVALYAASIVIAGFPTKRGLLLGRDLKHAAFPGGIKGAGLYALEHDLFANFPVRPKEISLDLLFSIVSSSITPIIAIAVAASEVTSVDAAADSATTVGAQVINYVVVIVFYVYMRVRRGMLKRH